MSLIKEVLYEILLKRLSNYNKPEEILMIVFISYNIYLKQKLRFFFITLGDFMRIKIEKKITNYNGSIFLHHDFCI